MKKLEEDHSTKALGGIMLVIGWIIAIAILGFLYQKSIYNTEPPVYETIAGHAKITLHKKRDGHFRIPIKIYSEEINFLVDTGATVTAISEPIAKKLNLPFDYPAQVSTAGGTVDAFATTIDELYLGSIRLENVTAIILPDMNTPALLGMNVLKKFTMLQKGKKLELTYIVPQSN